MTQEEEGRFILEFWNPDESARGWRESDMNMSHMSLEYGREKCEESCDGSRNWEYRFRDTIQDFTEFHARGLSRGFIWLVDYGQAIQHE